MVLKVRNKEYYTNITNDELISKCVDFFIDGCTSYAISFENEPKYHIGMQQVKNIDCIVLKGFNNSLKFVPLHAENDNDFDMVLSKGLDSIEII
jgi:hypothetical protein